MALRRERTEKHTFTSSVSFERVAAHPEVDLRFFLHLDERRKVSSALGRSQGNGSPVLVGRPVLLLMLS